DDPEGALVGVCVRATNREGSARRTADRAGGRGAITPVDRGGKVACHLEGITLIGEACDRTAELRAFGRCDRRGKQRSEIAFGDVNLRAYRAEGEVRLGLTDSHQINAVDEFVGVGVRAGDGEIARRSADRAGRGRAVAPIDGCGEITGRI